MLQFSKTIIEGVSFDRYLFGKELRKLVLWYGDDEEQKTLFHQWCVRNFGNMYKDVISDAFYKNDVNNEIHEKSHVLS